MVELKAVQSITSTYASYQYKRQNLYKHISKQEKHIEKNCDNDTFEHTSYSPYSMYNKDGQLYANCIARNLVAKNF